MMKEVRCSNVDDFRIAITRVHAKKQPSNDTEKWQYQQDYLKLLRDAPIMWDELLKQNQHIYNRLGYLDVIIHDDLSYERKKLRRGRPKEDKTRQYILNVRLDDELQSILKNYCNTNSKTESEVIRELIKGLK
jgi:hypothetical protein